MIYRPNVVSKASNLITFSLSVTLDPKFTAVSKASNVITSSVSVTLDPNTYYSQQSIISHRILSKCNT